MIYLPTPFTAPDGPLRRNIECRRYEKAVAIAHWFLAKRVAAFSPIAYCYHPHLTYGLPGTYHFWQPLIVEFISASNEVLFSCMENFAESTGMAAEWGIAYNLSKPVSFAIPKFSASSPTPLVTEMEVVKCPDFAKTGYIPYLSMLKKLNLLDISGHGQESTS